MKSHVQGMNNKPLRGQTIGKVFHHIASELLDLDKSA